MKVEFDGKFWDERYRSHSAVWSGNPNIHLVNEVSGLTPGAALDVGCGEGADAIWLAERGWRVSAADISSVALERARAVEVSVDVVTARLGHLSRYLLRLALHLQLPRMNGYAPCGNCSAASTCSDLELAALSRVW